MALMPGADYAGCWPRSSVTWCWCPGSARIQVPTAKVLGTWRAALGPAPLAGLQARLLAAVGGEHRDHDYRAVRVGDAPCTWARSTGP